MLIREPHAHAVAEKLHSGDHHHVAGMQPLCDSHAVVSQAGYGYFNLAHPLASGIDDKHRGASLAFGQRGERHHHRRGFVIDAAVTDAVMPSRMIGGGPLTVMRTE